MTTDFDDLVSGTLAFCHDSDLPIERRRRALTELRQTYRELNDRLDEALIARSDEQLQEISRLQEVFGELKGLNEKLTSAPVFEGVFLGQVPLADGRVLARVRCGPGDGLLNVLDDDLLGTLEVGDCVYVTTERNAILARCEAPTTRAGGDAARVVRWLSDGRLLVRHLDRELIVRAAAALTPATLTEGEAVGVDFASSLATERLGPSEHARYAASDKATSLPPEALAGYDEIRDGALRRITCAIAHPQIAARYGINKERPSILLSGPPGTGKTTLARVIAGMVQRETGEQCTIRKINGAELLSPYVGETEHRIRSLLRDTGGSAGFSLLFIDEVEAIARTRGGSGNVHSDRFLSSWLAELEGFEGRARFILVAATNRLDMLDAAFRSRFSSEIQMPRPRMGAARAIFSRHLAAEYPYYPGGQASGKTRLAMIENALAKLYLPNVSGASAATLRFRDGKTRTVAVRELVTGRLIEQICVEAREHAFQREVDGGRPGLCAEDLDAATEAARERLRTTLTPHNAHSYLDDLPTDVGVVAVDPATRARTSVTFLHQAVR